MGQPANPQPRRRSNPLRTGILIVARRSPTGTRNREFQLSLKGKSNCRRTLVIDVQKKVSEMLNIPLATPDEKDLD